METQTVPITTKRPDKVLSNWALPPSYPAILLPPKVRQFIHDVNNGVTKERIVSIANQRGLYPRWRDLGDEHNFGCAVVENGVIVPLIAVMVDPH